MKLLENYELKHTAYLKIIFNLYLKLWHLHFHAFPCKHKRKKKENQETHHIILKPGLQRLNAREHLGATKLIPFFSGSVLCSCLILLLSLGFPEPLPGSSDIFIPHRQTASSARITSKSCRTHCRTRCFSLHAWGTRCVTETWNFVLTEARWDFQGSYHFGKHVPISWRQ